MQNIVQNYPMSALLKTSWQAAVLILLVLTVQWGLGRRLGPRWRYTLWFLVVLRLALPWTLPSSVSLFNLLDPSRAGTVVASLDGSTKSGESKGRGAGLGEPRPPQTEGKLAVRAGWPGVSRGWLWVVVWAAGTCSLGAYLWITHYRISRAVTSCRPLIDAPILNLLEDCKQVMGLRVPVSLVETGAVSSPSLFGFVRPRLLLPMGLTRSFTLEELRFVFLHELAHIKRQDIFTGWLMTALQIVHWFNPLVWLAFYRMRVDRELACDALALSYAREKENQAYGRTMIKLLEGFGCPAWAPSLAGTVESKSQMKERISMIAKYQKSSRGPALAGLLFGGLGLITLTDAQSDSKPADLPSADGGEPKIVATTPAAGATEVDPSLTELVVTFDRDMAGGFSWTGGGPNYPVMEDGARAKWRDKRTCVLPVRLESGHYYRVGINSKDYRNFRSAEGMPALPSAIYFTTQGASEELKAKTVVPKVIDSLPVNGDQSVSPGLTELRVTFDVPMGGGFSWCNADSEGADFPKGPEGKRPYWTEDHKTCVLPVELQPGKTYRLSLNAPSVNNFQSATGVPIEPVEYTFKTSAQ